MQKNKKNQPKNCVRERERERERERDTPFLCEGKLCKE